MNLIASVRPVPENWSWGEAKKILLYSESLKTTALVRAIKEKRPFLKIDVVANARNQWMWCDPDKAEHRTNRDINVLRMPPVPASVLDSYDGSILLESIDEDFGPPILTVYRDEEIACWNKLTPNPRGDLKISGGYFILGLDGPRTNALPLNTWLDFIRAVRKKHPNAGFYGLSRTTEGVLLQIELEKRVKNYQVVHDTLSRRELACFLRTAGCVIGASDLYIHLAAAMNTPSVELCSTQKPQPYPLNTPVFKREACRVECNWTNSDFRAEGISTDCYTPLVTHCARMNAITGREIFEAAQTAFNKKFIPGADPNVLFPPLPE